MLQGLDTKQKLSAVFLAFLCLVVATSLWSGLRFTSHTEKIPFSPQQLKKIEECTAGGSDLVDVAETSFVCYPSTETKRDIVLLSTYPVTGAPIVRTVYEEGTGVSSFTQYLEGGNFVMACDFQTGPWKLYCNKHPDKIECAKQSPPPENTPYLVNTNYPVYGRMCESLGYPLPRHEKVIHVIRNPVDNIEAWVHYEYEDSTREAWTNPTVQKYIDEYYSWHSYWKEYHYNQPEIPTLWVRYEDFCLCMEPALRRMLEFSDAIPKKDQEAMATIIQDNPCVEAKQVGKGVSLLVYCYFCTLMFLTLLVAIQMFN